MASPEYITMIECTVELTQDFADNLEIISDLLLSKHLISPSIKEQAVHSTHQLPSSRASKLVSVLTSRIELQPEAFLQMVELLDPAYFSLSLSALRNKYNQNGGKDLPVPTVKAPPPSISNAAQNGYHHQGLPGGHHPQGLIGGYHRQGLPEESPQIPPPLDYTNEPRKATAPKTDYTQPTPRFNNPTVYCNEPIPYLTSAPPSYHQFPEGTTDVPDSVTTLDSRPEADELLWLEKNNKNVRIVPRVAAEWENLALYLGIESYIVRIIKKDKSRCEDGCVEMFQRWLDGEGEGPRTWEHVASALEKIDDHETAYLIRQVLGDET